MCGFIKNVAQLVEHDIGNTEVTGSNPVKAVNFLQASFFELHKRVIPGDHFITYSSESLHAVQIYDYFMHDYSLIQKDHHDHQSQTRSLPEQVSAKDSPHILAEHHLKLPAAQNNKNKTNHTAEEMEMDQPCTSHDTYSPAESRPQMDP